MKWISKLRESELFRKIVYYCVVAFTFLYVFCVPSFGESTSILRYLIYISMILLGVSTFVYCFLFDDFKLNRVSIFIPLFAIYALVGTIFYSHEYRAWFSLILLSISFYIFVYAFKVIKNQNLIILVIALAFFGFASYFIFHYRNDIIHFRSFDKFRLGRYFDNENGVAAYASIGFATSLYLVLFSKKKLYWLMIVPVAASFLVGLTTGSRTFLIMSVIFVILFLFFKFKKHPFIFLISLGILVGVGIIVINLPFLSTLKERLFRFVGTLFGGNTKVDTSTVERIVWTDYGFYLGFKKLIFGYGVDGFSHFSGVGTYSHSNYAELLCDFGLIGLVIFYLPLIILLYKAITSKNINKPFVISFFIYYVVASFSTIIYYKKIYFLVLAFMFYLVYVAGKTVKSGSTKRSLSRVLFTCDTMSSGGAERVIALLSNEMLKRGISVKIIGVSDYKNSKSFYKLDDGVEYETIHNDKFTKPNPLKKIIELRTKVNNYEPDVVISFLPHVNVYTCVSLIGLSIPHITSERNNPYVDPKNKILRVLKKLSFIFADGHVFQTEDAKHFYKSKRVQENSSIIKNPLNLTFLPNDFVWPKKKVILSVGRLTKQKNYYLLIDAFIEFNRRCNDSYILKIYGDGPLRDELKLYCANKNVSSAIEFCGNSTKWHETEYGDALYILSSDYEGLPNSLIEALALGIPSISTDCPSGGPRELIKDGENGFLVSCNNVNELVEKMLKINQENSALFYKNTRNIIRDYDINTITTQWVNYIETLLWKKYF